MDLTYITTPFTNLQLFSSSIVIPLVLLFLMIVLITRETDYWQILPLPLMLMLKSLGFLQGWIGASLIILAFITFFAKTKLLKVTSNVIGLARQDITKEQYEGKGSTLDTLFWLGS